MSKFTHIDADGRVRMVDVSDKQPTLRVALAEGRISMNPDTFEKIRDNRLLKGNVLETARIAGIMGAKRTADLIPMCHPLNLTHVYIDFFPEAATHSIRIEAQAKIIDQTGVEMEALSAVSVAALTIYDMCKASDKEMVISDIRLLEKSGGKSGPFKRSGTP